MTVIQYNQRDSRWRYEKLGYSTKSIGGYGCTLTCLASMISYVYGREINPSEVNKKLKEVGGFYGALVVWSKVGIAFPKVSWIKRGYNYSNVDVAFNVYVRGVPTPVEVNGAKIGAYRHWILFIGGGKALDPWTGQIISTSYYPLTGYSLFKRV